MKIIETFYFMNKKIETKNADLLQAFQVSVKKLAGHQKNSVRCFSRFIALGVLHTLLGILGGNTLKLRMPAMGRHSKF